VQERERQAEERLSLQGDIRALTEALVRGEGASGAEAGGAQSHAWAGWMGSPE